MILKQSEGPEATAYGCLVYSIDDLPMLRSATCNLIRPFADNNFWKAEANSLRAEIQTFRHFSISQGYCLSPMLNAIGESPMLALRPERVTQRDQQKLAHKGERPLG